MKQSMSDFVNRVDDPFTRDYDGKLYPSQTYLEKEGITRGDYWIEYWTNWNKEHRTAN